MRSRILPHRAASLGLVQLSVGPGSLRRRRRRRRRAGGAAVLTVAAFAFGVLGGTASSGGEVVVDPPPAAGAATSDPAVTASDVAATAPVTRDGAEGASGDAGTMLVDEVPAAATSPVLARSGDLPIHLPAATAVVVGYHEAATVSAIGLTPVGVLREDRNTTRTDLPADDTVGTEYLVLSSRGRSAGPTSAIDIVLDPSMPVLAPVTGTVTDVRTYLLYGAHEDLRIEIVPDGHPDVRVVLIHVDDGQVSVGDRVTGGLTPLAGSARRFPFGSHIDRETEPERLPHVHLELKPADAGRGDDEAGSDDGGADARDADDPVG